MKTTLKPTLFIYIFCIGIAVCQAQNEDHPWQVSFGINVIDVYPTGVSKYGAIFEDFFNSQDHWNLGSTPILLQATNLVGKGFSFGGRASFNTITKYGAQSANDPYYNVDGIIKYNWNQFLQTEYFVPYFEMGGGYAIFDAVGAGYFNLGVGIEYWFGEEKRTGIVLGSLYRNTGETYGIKHFQHHLAITYRFGKRDNDNDGVVNPLDQCPEVPGILAFNGCPDSDNDGIPDSEDLCPEVWGIEEFKGCPDSDGDGVEDALDACVEVPGLAAFNGCPDSDNDGIPDSEDLCPELWGIEDFKGCPDSDGDGVEDSLDACVDQVGTIENNGCPEKVNEKQDPKDLSSWDEFEMNVIFFDSDKNTLKNESFLTLNEVARILQNNPSFLLIIKGHADSTASKNYNQLLSERRALAAKNYLIAKSIDPSRIEAIGFGETEPARSNDSKEGRAYNRRVEFTIIK